MKRTTPRQALKSLDLYLSALDKSEAAYRRYTLSPISETGRKSLERHQVWSDAAAEHLEKVKGYIQQEIDR